MRMLSGFVLVVFSIPLLAAPRKPDSKQSFTSPNGTFKFQHSSLLLECKQSPKQAGRWMPDSCEAYSSVCDDSDPKVTTIACFAYPKTKYKDFPSFEAAAFSVAEITAATTRNVCLSGSPDWVIDPRGSGRTVAINGVNFKNFEIDGAVQATFSKGMYIGAFIGINVTNSVSGLLGLTPPITIRELSKGSPRQIGKKCTVASNELSSLSNFSSRSSLSSAAFPEESASLHDLFQTPPRRSD